MAAAPNIKMRERKSVGFDPFSDAAARRPLMPPIYALCVYGGILCLKIRALRMIYHILSHSLSAPNVCKKSRVDEFGGKLFVGIIIPADAWVVKNNLRIQQTYLIFDCFY